MALGLKFLRLGRAAEGRLARWGARATRYEKAGAGIRRFLHPFKTRTARLKAARIRTVVGIRAAPGGVGVGAKTGQRARAYGKFKTLRRRGLFAAGAGGAGYGYYKYRQNRKQMYGY